MTRRPGRTWRAAQVFSIGAAILAGTLSAAPPALAGTENNVLDPSVRPFVSGWMPYWTPDSSLASFTANAALFGDVTGFWHSATGVSTITDQLGDTQRAEIVAAVHAKGVKVMGAVTDGTPARAMAGILASSTSRSAHVKALVDLAVANDYDGIDLDYEKFAFSDGSSTWAATRPSWVSFVKQLSAALHAKGLWLTASVPVMYDSDRDGSSGYWVYDYAGIGDYVDRLRIMTYDYSVSSTGPIAPISWVRRVLDYAVTQVSSTKIQVGVPAYGRDWSSSTAGCPSDNMPARETLTSREALALAKAEGVTPTWDSTQGERTFTYRKKYTGTSSSCTVTRTVWFEEDSAAITRARLVGEYKLAGIAQWSVGGEDPQQWSRFRDYGLSISKVSPRVELFAGDSVYSRPLTVSARATTAAGTPIAGETWSLYWRDARSTTWTKKASGETSASGTLSFTSEPKRSGYWKLGLGGSWTRYKAWTKENRTTVAIHVSAGFSRTLVKSGSTVTLKGSVGPDAEGLLVERQRYVGGSWSTVGSTTTRSDGTYSMAVQPVSRGTYTYRVKVSGSIYRAAGYSSTIHMTVS